MAALLSMTPLGMPREARAQTSEDLDAARRLFTEALGDEQASRFSMAVEKYRAVAAVKDTANVRFRMGACLEALGQLVDAQGAYRAAATLGADDAAAADTVRAANDRVSALDARVAHLTIAFTGTPPADAVVSLDGTSLPGDVAGHAIPVDPGAHVVEARASQTKAFRSTISLAEAGTAVVHVVLAPLPRQPLGGATPFHEPGPPAADAPSSGPPTASWIAFAAGGALAAGAGVSLGLRESAISSIRGACGSADASGALTCPDSSKASVSGDRDRAQVLGPLAAGLGVAAVLSVSLGVYWWWSAPSRTTAWLAPALGPATAGITAGGTWQ